jgi:hypothetical protein
MPEIGGVVILAVCFANNRINGMMLLRRGIKGLSGLCRYSL